MASSEPASPVNIGSRSNLLESPVTEHVPGAVTSPLKSILKNRDEHSPIAPNASAIYRPMSSDEDDEGSSRNISANQNTLPNNQQFSRITDSRILDKEKMKLGKGKIKHKKLSHLQLSHEKKHSTDEDGHEDKSPQGPSTSNGGGSHGHGVEDSHQH